MSYLNTTLTVFVGFCLLSPVGAFIIWLGDTIHRDNDVLESLEKIYAKLSFTGFAPMLVVTVAASYLVVHLAIQKARETPKFDTVPGITFRDKEAQLSHTARQLEDERCTVAKVKADHKILQQQFNSLERFKNSLDRMVTNLTQESIELNHIRHEHEDRCGPLRRALIKAEKLLSQKDASTVQVVNANSETYFDGQAADQIKQLAAQKATLAGQLNEMTTKKDALDITCEELREDLEESRNKCVLLESAIKSQQTMLAAAESQTQNSTLQSRLAKEKLVAETRSNLQAQVKKQVEAALHAEWEAEANAKMRPYMAEGHRLHVENIELHSQAQSLSDQNAALKDDLTKAQADLETANYSKTGTADHSACELKLTTSRAKWATNLSNRHQQFCNGILEMKEHCEKQLKEYKKAWDEQLANSESARVANHQNTLAVMKQKAVLEKELTESKNLLRQAQNKPGMPQGELAKELQDLHSQLAKAKAQINTQSKGAQAYLADKKAACVHGCPRHCKMGSLYTKEWETHLANWEVMIPSEREAWNVAVSEWKESGKWDDPSPESKDGLVRRARSFETHGFLEGNEKIQIEFQKKPEAKKPEEPTTAEQRPEEKAAATTTTEN